MELILSHSLLGFNSAGMLVAQVSSSVMASSTLPLNVWTHVIQTFSVINDLRLYINGTLH